MAALDGSDRINEADPSRRAFLKTFVAAAFVAPAIASFALDGIADAATATMLPNQSCPNQTYGNQGFPDHCWTGVLPPINPNGCSVFKVGSTIPVKWAYTGDCAGMITSATFAFYKCGDEDGGDEHESSCSAFRYDQRTGQYVYNWSTKRLRRGTYCIIIDFGYCGWRAYVKLSLR